MGHIQDRWYRQQRDPLTGELIRDSRGRIVREKTPLFGKGDRYKVRYIAPDGKERSKSFPDKQKKLAEDFLIGVESDKREGKYVDRDRGRIAFDVFSRKWLSAQVFDHTSRERVVTRLRNHIDPYFEGKPLSSIKTTDVQAWLRKLQEDGLSQNYRHVLFGHLVSIFSFAVDDKRVVANPCHGRSVIRPARDQKKVVVWPLERAKAVREALPERCKITVPLGSGLGLRQGEIFGLAIDDLDRDREIVRVVRQVRQVGGVEVFAPPKGGKVREVPLSSAVRADIDDYAKQFEPVSVTLPWLEPDGKPVTVRLIMTDRDRAWRRQSFNDRVWLPALTKAKIDRTPQQDGVHALRHLYASVLLDAGESITALAQYLGHSDPGFTLRIYTHLLPTSHDRTRTAIDAMFDGTA